MLCIVLVASLFTGFAASASADDVIVVTLKDGDYLYKVCKNLGLDYYQCKNAIKILNNFTSETQLNRLTVGQTIKLPASNAIAATIKSSSATTTTVTTSTTVNGTTTTTTTTNTVSGNMSNYNVAFYLVPYVPQYGDTFGSICTKFGTSFDQYSSLILKSNGLASASGLTAGKTVYIPSTKAPASGGFYAVVNHVVASGETITGICSAYGTSYSANSTLVNGLNAGKDLNKIYANQTVYIPVVSSAVNISPVPGTPASPNAAVPAQSGYNIEFENTMNGNPYAVVNSVMSSKADLGKTVTVVPNARSGYAQERVEVIRADSLADIKMTGNTFVMPPCDVIIHVYYKTAKSITRTPAMWGSYKTLVNGVETDFAGPNDKVVLTFAPDKGYSCSSVTCSTDIGNSVSVTQDNSGEWSFVMPNSNVNVSVTFSQNGSLSPIKSTLGKGCTGITFWVDGIQCTKAAKNTQVVAAISLQGGYSISSVYAGSVAATKQDDTHYVFKMPAGEVNVTVNTSNTQIFSVTDASSGNGTIHFTNDAGALISTAKPGETVHVLVKPNSMFEYVPDSVLVTFAGGASRINTNKITDNEYTFAMVGDNVSVNAGWREVQKAQGEIRPVRYDNGFYDIWVQPVGGSFTQSNFAHVGEEVQVRTQGNRGYICTGLIAYQESDPNKTNLITAYHYWPNNSADISDGMFTMPAGGNICFEATFVPQAQYVSISNYSGGDGSATAMIGGGGVSSALTGATIDIVCSPNANYRLTALKLVRGTGEEVSLAVADNRASYTVRDADYNSDPAKNVLTVKPVFAPVGSFAVSVPDAAVCATSTAAANATVTVTVRDSSTSFVPGTIDVYRGSKSDGSYVSVGYSLSEDAKTITFTMPAANVVVETAVAVG